jgi:hypothetical protein
LPSLERKLLNEDEGLGRRKTDCIKNTGERNLIPQQLEIAKVRLNPTQNEEDGSSSTDSEDPSNQ